MQYRDYEIAIGLTLILIAVFARAWRGPKFIDVSSRGMRKHSRQMTIEDFRQILRGRLPGQPAESNVGMFTNVRIKATPVTSARNLAGRIGEVRGETTPSVTGIDVIGTPAEDYAVNVFFEELDEGYWFSNDLVEFVEHSVGAIAALDGIDKQWVKNAQGGWDEISTGPS